MPPSRFDGHEPAETTTYEYEDGRVVRSTTVREPAWTDLDRAEILALALYRSWLCPKCGGLLEECTSRFDTGPAFLVRKIRCRATDELINARESLKKTERPDALVWSVRQAAKGEVTT